MFDDDAKGLVREPFVCGMPEIMDVLVADIKGAENGFALYFSHQPFPAYQLKIDWDASELGGNWYRLNVNGIERKGWLCPALFKYVERPPDTIYVKAGCSMTENSTLKRK
jgi:hypothetical protein